MTGGNPKEDKKQNTALTDELDDERLELVSGGTDVEEEEEEIPTFEDEWAAYEALIAGKPCITCQGCGRTIVVGPNPVVTCVFCGRKH